MLFNLFTSWILKHNKNKSIIKRKLNEGFTLRTFTRNRWTNTVLTMKYFSVGDCIQTFCVHILKFLIHRESLQINIHIYPNSSNCVHTSNPSVQFWAPLTWFLDFHYSIPQNTTRSLDTVIFDLLTCHSGGWFHCQQIKFLSHMA